MSEPVRWCDHLPARTAIVHCGGEDHRFTWRRGKIVLEDHDLAAERAMLALGGQPRPCVQTLNLWRQLHSWRIPAQVYRRMQTGAGHHNLLAPPELAPVVELSLALTWERAWKRAPRDSDHAALVEDQLRRRATPVLLDHVRAWRRRSGARLVSAVEVSLAAPGRPPAVAGSMDAVAVSARAVLGAGWLVRVWARGLAVVDDAFVLDVVATEGRTATPPGAATVIAVTWEEAAEGRWAPVAGPAVATQDPEGRWRLSPVPEGADG